MSKSDALYTFPRPTTRNLDELRGRLQQWLAHELGPGSDPQLSDLRSPGAMGYSSETLLFDLTWQAGVQQHTGSYVARLQPTPENFPMFPDYNFDRQVGALRLLAERTTVPVPPVPWYEPDAAFLGSPFFIMERVEGLVPPDMMPYTCGSWLSEASPAEQAAVARDAVAILAGIHSVPATREELAFLDIDRPGDTALRRHFEDQKVYYQWVRGDWECPIVDRTFAWLESHWPAQESEPVLCWGDARLGNVLWRDFRAVAVLDWELAALAPRETDLAWMIFFQVYFQDVAERFGKVGMPGFMRRDDVVAAYTKLTGCTPRDLDWYLAYTGLRQALISIRTAHRRVHFGEIPRPADSREVLYHANLMERAIDGSPDPWA